MGAGCTSQWNNEANWKAKGEVADGIPQNVIVCIFYYKKDKNGKRTKTLEHTGLYYNGQTGYVNGGYFKQMTVSEADAFFASPQYLEGIANNTETTSTKTANPTSSQPVTTGSPTGIVSAEDQRVSTWTNPDSVVKVTFKLQKGG